MIWILGILVSTIVGTSQTGYLNPALVSPDILGLRTHVSVSTFKSIPPHWDTLAHILIWIMDDNPFVT